MDWALITWGILIGMVGLLWAMVVASVQDETATSHSDGTSDQIETADEAEQRQEQYEHHAAA
jgi:uncharacterized membrane protein (DUF485 family)